MTDPEILHRRLTSGDAGSIRACGTECTTAARTIDGAGDDFYAATGIPVWTGDGASAFQVRAASLLKVPQQAQVTVRTLGGGLTAIGETYADVVTSADKAIGYWRNRPAIAIPLLEDLLRSVVCAQLEGIGNRYGSSLWAVESTLKGEPSDVDPDDVSDETREWLDRGEDKTKDWYEKYGSTEGPLIPHTKGTGDDGGLIPQGLGYDPASGMLLQTYYQHDGSSVLSIIDPVTGQEVNRVNLGSDDPKSDATPGHAGGVTVIGDQVIVSSDGKLYTYSMNGIQNAPSGTTVHSHNTDLGDDGPPGSYVAQHDGLLYVGDYGHDKMYVYEMSNGHWVKHLDSSGHQVVYDTPSNTQGVVVRDDQIIYSTSPNRFDDSHMIVQDHDGNELGSYTFPNMAEGIVEYNGQLVTTYESGADKYSRDDGKWGWIPGVSDEDDLWPSTHMSMTPLGALQLEAEPSSLIKASAELRTPATDLAKAAKSLQGLDVSASILGDVPEAASFSQTCQTQASDTAGDLTTASQGMERMADEVDAAARRYRQLDDAIGAILDGLNPWG